MKKLVYGVLITLIVALCAFFSCGIVKEKETVDASSVHISSGANLQVNGGLFQGSCHW